MTIPKAVKTLPKNNSNVSSIKTRVIGFSMTYKTRLQEHNEHLNNQRIYDIIQEIDELMKDLIK